MLPLLRSDPLLPEFPPFMFDVLEVVYPSAESPKCVRTRNKQRPEAPARSCKNWTIRLGKPEGPVLSGPTAIRGIAGLRRGASPPAKLRLDGIGANHDNFEG
jgi:hypothetical protein